MRKLESPATPGDDPHGARRGDPAPAISLGTGSSWPAREKGGVDASGWDDSGWLRVGILLEMIGI